MKYEPEKRAIFANSSIREGYKLSFCLVCFSSPKEKPNLRYAFERDDIFIEALRDNKKAIQLYSDTDKKTKNNVYEIQSKKEDLKYEVKAASDELSVFNDDEACSTNSFFMKNKNETHFISRISNIDEQGSIKIEFNDQNLT